MPGLPPPPQLPQRLPVVQQTSGEATDIADETDAVRAIVVGALSVCAGTAAGLAVPPEDDNEPACWQGGEATEYGYACQHVCTPIRVHKRRERATRVDFDWIRTTGFRLFRSHALARV